MAQIILTILICLILGIIITLIVLIYNTPSSKIQEIFNRVFTQKEKQNISEQEEKPSLEDIIRNIVKKEIEQAGDRIIRSFPRPVNVNQNDIINEILYNRLLLERLIVLHNKQNEDKQSKQVKPQQEQFPIIKYARMVDSDSPSGFQTASLSNISNGACYQICINSENQATYRLITNLDIQKEIIAMFNPIITSGCEYEEEPMAINEIIPVKDGILELHSGIWNIIEKAKIRFV